MPENLHGPARDERRASEQRDTKLFGGPQGIGNRKRNPARCASTGDLLNELEHPGLRRVLAAKQEARPLGAALQRGALSRRHIIDVRIRPEVLGSDQSREAPPKMI